jgi:hypothetical protein
MVLAGRRDPAGWYQLGGEPMGRQRSERSPRDGIGQSSLDWFLTLAVVGGLGAVAAPLMGVMISTQLAGHRNAGRTGADHGRPQERPCPDDPRGPGQGRGSPVAGVPLRPGGVGAQRACPSRGRGAAGKNPRAHDRRRGGRRDCGSDSAQVPVPGTGDRPYVNARASDPFSAFTAEADRHPVFRLTESP